MTQYDILFIGGGIGCWETILNLAKNPDFKPDNNVNIAIINTHIETFVVGQAYTLEAKRFATFNNPLRLSPLQFQEWIFKNKERLSLFCSNFYSHIPQHFKEANSDLKQKLLSSKTIFDLEELYLPRSFFGLWMHEKIVSLLSNITDKLKINIDYFLGHASLLEKSFSGSFKIFADEKNLLKLSPAVNTLHAFSVTNFSVSEHTYKTYLTAKNIVLATGVLPPYEFSSDKAVINHPRYVSRLYEYATISNLSSQIYSDCQTVKTKPLNIIIIGSKSGMLEVVSEIFELFKNNLITAKLLSLSGKTLISAEKSTKFNSFSLSRDYVQSYESGIKPEKLFDCIQKEYLLAHQAGFTSYDVWTKTLVHNYMKVLRQVWTPMERAEYDKKYLTKIRSISRFTNPDLVSYFNSLSNCLVCKSEAVQKISLVNNSFEVVTDKAVHKYIDYIINASSTARNTNFTKSFTSLPPIIRSLSNFLNANYSTGFAVNENLEVINCKGIFLPTGLRVGFNPERKTVLVATLMAAKKLAEVFAKIFS
jgi:uncharacterized NAD(P)/FAD-binding protein YdhS